MSPTQTTPGQSPLVVNRTRRRIHREMPRVQTVYPLWAAWVGLLFVAVGLAVGYSAWTSAHANRLIVVVLMGNFVLAGGLVTAFALRSHRLRQRVAAAGPLGAWTTDYPWNPRATNDGTVAHAGRMLLALLGFLVFLGPIGWFLGAKAKPPMMVWGIFGLFGLVLVFMAIRAVYLLLRAAKFGRVTVGYGAFPFHPGDSVTLTFHGGAPLAERDGLQAELLCVEEFWETTGSGKSRSSKHAHEAVYSAACTFSTDGFGQATLTFPLPADGPGTRLVTDARMEKRICYWELEIRRAEPGVDYAGRFLIPIYARG